MPQYLGPQPNPIHNSAFSIHPLRKSNFLSFIFIFDGAIFNSAEPLDSYQFCLVQNIFRRLCKPMANGRSHRKKFINFLKSVWFRLVRVGVSRWNQRFMDWSPLSGSGCNNGLHIPQTYSGFKLLFSINGLTTKN